MKKSIPKFKNEAEERAFWSTHSPLDFVEDIRPIKLSFTNLKPSTQAITIRLPKPMLRMLKLLANEQDIPYQSLLKMLLYEKIKEKLMLKR